MRSRKRNRAEIFSENRSNRRSKYGIVFALRERSTASLASLVRRRGAEDVPVDPPTRRLAAAIFPAVALSAAAAGRSHGIRSIRH